MEDFNEFYTVKLEQTMDYADVLDQIIFERV